MDEPVRSRASGTTDVGAGWQRLFPNWRLLLGAALATLVITTIVLARRDTALAPAATVFPGDTLVIADGDDPRIVRYAIPNGSGGLQLLERTLALPSIPSWVDSLAAAWTHRVPSPTGDRVALAHVTPSGTDVLIVSSSRRDTLVLIAGTGEARPFDWSPDGRSLLVGVTQGAGEGLDLDLVVFRDRGDAFVRAPIDTVPQRSVVEAAWSPDGSRIAWVARVGQQRQLEVFVGNADGSGARNVSRHPADDQHISWSPNGELLAFTSGRDGNAELYAMAFREERLWRLTFDDAQDDAGRFSTDGRLIAFESTRGGASGVYVMPALGGEPARLDLSGNVSVRGWRGLRSRFVDRVTVSSLSAGGVGDTMVLAVRLRDQFREDLPSRSVDWRVMDSAIARPVSALSGETLRVVGRAGGLARVVADVGKWRSDTAFLRVGDVSLVLLSDQEGARAWRLIGDPLPTVAGGSIVLRSDRRWDSGVLSRALLPLLPGLEVVASIDVPTGSTDPAATLGIALVAPEDSSLIEISAPQFLRYASFVWSAEASRFVYSANREVFSEPAPPAVAGPMTIRLRIESDSTLSVAVGERQRWRSTIRVVGPQSSRARLWISSRGTGSGVRLHNASVVLGSVQRGNTN